MPLNSLVVLMQSGNDDCRAIEGGVVLVGSGLGVICCCVVVHLDIKEGIDGDNFTAHVVGPLENLGGEM